MPDSVLHIELDKHFHRIRIRGALDLAHFEQAENELEKACSAVNEQTTIDLSGITHLDTAGALLLRNALQGVNQENHDHEPVNLSPEHKALFTLVTQAKLGKPALQKTLSPSLQTIVNLGKATIEAWYGTVALIMFVGQTCIALAKVARHPTHLRFSSVMHYMETVGINAIPIIGLIAFIISFVIAYQGQVQLKPLGAEQYTVNLIAISVLREMGVMLTAIMVAGRSGSAFTAEIGTMKIREEIDALRTIGFDPFELLILPRIIALLIVLPLLTFIADITGLFGGALISISLLDISQTQYLERVRQVAVWQDFLAGLIKAPMFAFVIGIVSCMHGLKVSGSSEDIGKETTASVVQSIFLILMLDGFFSIYFQKVGL